MRSLPPNQVVRSTRQAGFSMLEVLAVLLLTGVIVSTLTVLTGQWLRGWNRSARFLEQTEGVALSLQRMASDIETAVALPATRGNPEGSFKGAASSLRFIHPSVGQAAAAGLEVVEISQRKGRGLIRSRGAFNDDIPLQSLAVGDPVVLLDDSFQVDFAYRADSGQWRADWTEVSSPSAVRILLRASSVTMPILTNVVALHSALPALCARATSISTCRGLANGETVGLPMTERTSNLRRFHAGASQ